MIQRKKFLYILIAVLFALTTVFTVLNQPFWIELFAPATLFSAYMLFSYSMAELGIHRFSASFLGWAMLCLIVCDVARFVNHFILGSEPYSDFLRFIYVLPSLFFAINETIYFWNKLRGRTREFSFLLVNTFAIAIIGFVLQYKFFVQYSGKIDNFLEFSYISFILIASYTAIMCILTFLLQRKEDIFKGPNLITVAILVYEIMDVQYVFMQAVGVEPDTYFGDLLYIVLIIMIAVGSAVQVEKKYYFEFKKIHFDGQDMTLRLVLAVLGIIISILLMVFGVIGSEENSNIIIVLLAYTVMNYLLYTGDLNERQNAILEKRVAEKTEQLRSANEKLTVLSSTDLLTGLYNRRYGREFLDGLVKDGNCRSFAVYCVDLNLFKPINDTYGHEMGDRVLEEFGRRMRSLPATFTSIRAGGDEFVIVQKIEDDTGEMTQYADMISDIFRTPVFYETYCFNLSASIGIAIYPDDADNISNLLAFADTAMYDIKSSGHKDGYRFFNTRLIQSFSIKDAIKRSLMSVDPGRDFVLYYQPQVDAATKEMIGVEAFPHLKGDMEGVSPGKLIPVAEELGVMSKLGIWIVREALTQVVGWNRQYGKDISLTVNLSPLQLIDSEYSKALCEIVSELGINTSMLTLDVANDVIMGAADSAKDSMKRLKERGFLLSLNDFGGDDINLSYVLECGFDGLKLSRSLVSTQASDPKVRTLIKTIMSIANEMCITVTAVGIEEEEQSQAMYDLGVTRLQGFLYGRPARAEVIEGALLKS